MPAPLLQDPSLTWGVLQLVGPPTEDLFEIEAVDGTDYGNPVPIIEALRSLLVDGALAVRTGYENREVPIRLRVSANDGEAFGEAEAALFQQVQLDQPPPLVLTSPIGLSAVTVFDTVVAKLERDNDEGWDQDEVLHGDRYYLLTLTCLPFVRPVESTVIPALPVPVDPEVPVWVSVDACESTSGWSRETNGGDPSGPTLDGAPSVEVSAFIDRPGDYLRLVRSGAIVVPDDHYLAVDVDVSHDNNITGSWVAYFNGSWHSPVSIGYGIGEDGSTRLFFDNVGTISELKIAFDFAKVVIAQTVVLSVYEVAYTDTIGSNTSTTHRQQSRLVTVTGSAPTQAALRVYDATPANLGTDILVYTSRNQTPPNLRRYIASSAPAASAPTNVSGSSNTLSTEPTVIRFPANLLTPGTYALMARINGGLSEHTLTWQARMTDLDGATVVGSQLVVSGEVEIAPNYHVQDLAGLVLPVIDVEGSEYAVELTLTADSSEVLLDEAWLFNLDDGVLTWIKDTEGLDWIEIRSPELGAARPSVWGGRDAVGTGGSCIDWKCLSFGPHRFDPGTMQIFTVTPESLKSQCEIEFFPRFFGHVWGDGTS